MTVRELDDEEGGGYFASVSDLMVGILFIFLLMLTVFALNYQHEEEVSRQQWQEAQERAIRLHKLLEKAATEVQREIDDRAAARNRLLQKLQSALSDRNIPVRVDWEAGILHLQESVLFLPSDASLGSEQRKIVANLADALAQTLPRFTAVSDRRDCDQGDLSVLETVLIEGHCDGPGCLDSFRGGIS